MSVSAGEGPASSPTTIEARAGKLIDDTTERFNHGREDLGDLLDRVCAELSQEASHELRQILAQAGAEIELLLLGSEGTLPPEAQTRLNHVLDALDRGSRTVTVYLDRSNAAQRLIRLHPRRADVGALLRTTAENLSATSPRAATLAIEPAMAEIDTDKLRVAFTHLIEHFAWAPGPTGPLGVRVREDDEQLVGFVGAKGHTWPAEALIEALGRPLEIEDVAVDIPYVRAVIERHGGSLHVEQTPEMGLGYGFTLPKVIG